MAFDIPYPEPIPILMEDPGIPVFVVLDTATQDKPGPPLAMFYEYHAAHAFFTNYNPFWGTGAHLMEYRHMRTGELRPVQEWARK
jgi:hypothetical protein